MITLEEVEELKKRAGKDHLDYNFLNMLASFGKKSWPPSIGTQKRLVKIRTKLNGK